ncbi:ARM repeat-containing protein, partial [Coprinellus micaceus]
MKLDAVHPFTPTTTPIPQIRMTKGYLMNSLVEKMQSPDQDFRYMGLNDLMTEIKQDPNSFQGDESVENRVLNQVLSLVEDKISRSKTRHLGQLIKILRQTQMELVVDKLIDFSGGKDEELRDISGLAASLTIFPTANLSPQPLKVLPPLLLHPRPVVRKRAILTVSQFIPISQAALFNDLLNNIILPNLAAGASVEKAEDNCATCGCRRRVTLPTRSHLLSKPSFPSILKALQRDDEELREGAAHHPAGTQFIKYDPNYAGDDEDEEMADADEDDEDDDDLADEYSDDEDTSYKIRRSATKLLAAVIGTRPELLTTIYKDISPVVISRFGDREENVRLEVWGAYVTLLKQTSVYGGSSQAKDDLSPRGKRKRGTEEVMDVEENAYTLLKTQVPSLAKALLNQIKSPKTSPAVLQAGLGILTIAKALLSQTSSSSTSALHLTCLSFLALLFSTHSPTSFSSSLPNITPVLLKLLQERHPRVVSETFRVFSSLLTSLAPVKAAPWVDEVYNQALSKLSNHDTDAEVRTTAEECVGDLWIAASEVMRAKDRKEWEYICRASGKTEGAVKVVTKVAKVAPVDDAWVNGCTQWLIGLLQKSGKAGKADVFIALEVLVKSYSAGVPADLPSALVPQIKPYVSTSDIALLAQALSVLAILLETAPATTFPEVEHDLLNDIYAISHSPLVSGPALEALFKFYSALVQADNQIATHLVPNLVIVSEKAPKAENSPANVARSVAQVVKNAQSVAAGVIAEYSKNIKPSSKAKASLVLLSLLIIGELGRFIDMSPQRDIFPNVIEHFSAEQEEIRSAAAFAAGNIAIGNLQQFLPAIVEMIKTDSKKRFLALHAAKEV